jgi:hypothetical protein
MATAPGVSFVPSPDVFAAEIGGALIALDLGSGAYHAFDQVATEMWRALTELGDRASALERLRARYDADPVRIERDLDALIARLTAGGFARWETAGAAGDREPRSIPRGRARARRPSTARAWWCLARTVLALRRRGFSAAYRRSADAALVEPVAPHERDAVAERAVRAFARAENLFVIGAAPRDCLPRSLALFRFLRECGVPAEHRIGVDRFPFRAHAWVEHGGRVVADHAGNAQTFTTIARIAG